MALHTAPLRNYTDGGRPRRWPTARAAEREVDGLSFGKDGSELLQAFGAIGS